MTRSEFLDTVQDFDALKFFCYQKQIYLCDDVLDQEQYDKVILETVRENGRFDTWQEILQFLYDLPDCVTYYTENEWGEYVEATDDDFEDYKQMVLDYMDTDGEWDEEDDERDEMPLDAEPDEEGITDEELLTIIGKAS